MKIISIMNSKGGVGKTTITANIGTELAFLGYKTLLIDTDPQANLTFSLIDREEYRKNMLYTRTVRNLFIDYIDHCGLTQLDDLIVHPKEINQHVNHHLDLLCSHINLDNITNLLLKKKLYSTKQNYYLEMIHLQSILRKALKKLNTEYDFVLIDCSPSYNLLTQNALVASDYYLVPVKLDYFSQDGLLQLMTHIEQLIETYNENASRERFGKQEVIQPQLMGILPNMVNMRNQEPISTQKNYLNQIVNLEVPIFKQMLRESSSVHFKAPEKRVPIVVDPQIKEFAPIKDELKVMVHEFLERVEMT